MLFGRKYIRCVFLLMVLIIAADVVQAQRKDFKYKFIAKVMNADTAVVIPNCHVINKTQNMGTVSDEYGAFTITANVNDSVQFSAIGYAKLTIAVRDSMYSNTRIVKLTPVAYPLSEVDIGILSTYEKFRRDMMAKEAEQMQNIAPLISKYEIYIPPLPNQGGINIPGLGSPVTFLYNLWSKEGKHQRYYLSVVNGTAEYIIVGDKFNGLQVHRLTGLENDELVKFMSYCQFTKEYLLLASEAEINRMIMLKYNEYVKTKADK